MIVRAAGTRLQLITQPDHAQLARRLMAGCAALAGHPRRSAILHAIGEHDNGWTEPDAAPLVDRATGDPVDFVHAPVAIRHDLWPRAVRRLATSPWAAALVAQHALSVYDRYAADPAWTPFFTRMSMVRDGMLRASGERAEHLAADYVYVRLGDLLSLAFCTDWPGELTFEGWTVVRSGSHVQVTPDPFDGRVMPVSIRARELRRGPYATDAELQAEFARAPTIVLTGTASARPA